MSKALVVANTELDRYVREISEYPVLDREEEQALAIRFRDHGDVAAAHQLVVSNLRFVVKVAHQYRGYGLKLLDIIQEGNIGLMHAVKKFDPDKGYRLISYAVWWIRAQMQAFILKSWSLVKLGAGRVRRKLFFGLRSARSRLQAEGIEEPGALRESLARSLGVSEEEISEMELRLAGRDFSLDVPVGEDGDTNHLDMLESEHPEPEALVAARQERELLGEIIDEGSSLLNEKEAIILDRRLLNEEPPTLAELGSELGVSRERIRQLEQRVIRKLRSVAEGRALLPAPA